MPMSARLRARSRALTTKAKIARALASPLPSHAPTSTSMRDTLQRFDVLLYPVTPLLATKHGLYDALVDGQAISAFQVMSATSPFSLSGLPAMIQRFGTSRNGSPVNFQIAASCYAESSMFDLKSRLEAVSPTGNLRPERWL